jgi:hypothetical protein
VIDIGQGDTEHSTILHVPSIAAVVGGDIVYNQVHMMTAETDDRSREDWISSLDQIAALDPRIVVSGHKRVGAPDDPKTIGESQQYLRGFSRVVGDEETVDGIVSKVLERHLDRDNPRVVGHSAREAVKKRQPKTRRSGPHPRLALDEPAAHRRRRRPGSRNVSPRFPARCAGAEDPRGRIGATSSLLPRPGDHVGR